jgi:ribosomal protein RSM22 (predicted rRNA methylase)
LWRYVAPGGILVLLENGNPLGFELIKTARSAILQEAHPGKLLAPCPHSLDCQMSELSWCHFKQRVHLLEHERALTKGKPIDKRDIPYSFVIFRKPDISDSGKQHP